MASTRSSGIGRAVVAAGMALSLGWGGQGARAASVGTPAETQFLPAWLAYPSAGVGALALVNMPPGWATGDAAVVLAPGGWPPGARDRLVAAILDAGAAVLELHGAPPGRTEAEDVAAALRTLRAGFGAGLVTLVGPEPAEDAPALRAAAAGYHAAVLFGTFHAELLRGPEPEAREAWPDRAARFCDVLATGLADHPGLGQAGCHAALSRR